MQEAVYTREDLEVEFWTQFFMHCLFFVWAACMLDMGETLKCWQVATLGYWVGACLIFIRRRDRPAESDMRFLKTGYY